MVPGGTDANPMREHGSCTLTHGCIGPTYLFHIKQLHLLYRQDTKIWLSAIFRFLYEVFLCLNVLAGILAQACGL